MKTLEEIKQLAEDFTTKDNGHYHYRGKECFIKGYVQCQEDMVDKKYTESDIRKAINVGTSAEAGDYPDGWSFKLGIRLEDYFINTLKKQD